LITGHATTPIGAKGTFTSFSPDLEVERSAGIRRVYPRFGRRRSRGQSGRQDRRRGARRLKLPDKYRDYNMTNARVDIQARV
jgi:hypothetical protein